MDKVVPDNNAKDKIKNEEPSLLHNLEMVKRRETRAIRNELDKNGNIITSHHNVLNNFVTHLRGNIIL